MKIRFMLDDTDKLLNGEKLKVRPIARDNDCYPPYWMVEVCGEIDDVRIRRPNGQILKPTRTVDCMDFVMIVEWAFTLID